MTLTKEQEYILYQIVRDIKCGKKEVKLAGYAGTGKTFLAKYITKFFSNFAVCAFTGKATNVLNQRGIEATTIHRLIYEPVVVDDIMTFSIKNNLECSGIIVDEASMVSKELYHDLKFFNLPIIFIGDHGQLEPVGTEFNLMSSPDYRLETIHRNAGEIAQFAQWIRMGKNPFAFHGDNSQVEFITKQDVTIEDYANADQVICAFNATRVQINSNIRKHLGYDGTINTGEKIICIQNNQKLRLFNGMQGYVKRLRKKDQLDFETVDYVYKNINYDKEEFGKEKSIVQWQPDMPIPFHYAYCVTAHKAQGSEFDEVFVIEQRCKQWDHRRWAYTAASRAKKRLKWLLCEY